MNLPMLLDSASTLCKAFVDKTVVCGLWSVVYGHPALVPLYKTYREESDGNIGQVFSYTPFYAQHQGTEYL